LSTQDKIVMIKQPTWMSKSNSSQAHGQNPHSNTCRVLGVY